MSGSRIYNAQDAYITQKRGNYITMKGGFKYYVDEYNVEDIPISSLAWTLARKGRFHDHCDKFYSVAEHCVRVSRLVPEEHAFAGLMHDVGEGVLPDVPAPVKYSKHFERIVEYEDTLMTEFSRFYNFAYPCEEVDEVDKYMAHAEALIVFNEPPEWAYCEPAVEMLNRMEELEMGPLGWTKEAAYNQFMERFIEFSRSARVQLRGVFIDS